MRYRTPEHRTEAVTRVVEALTSARRVVLTTHVNADGDGCGSEIALATWLEARGIRTRIVNPTPYPDMYAFLLHRPEWVLHARSSEAKTACREADLAVVLDTGEVPRLGRVKPLVDGVEKVVVDHHEAGPHPIEGLSLRDPSACAAGELVYDILQAAAGGDGEVEWSEPLVRGIYVAVLTDTGSFRFSNSTPRAHEIAADLVERGIDPEEMYRKAYGTAPFRRYRLLSAALEELELDEERGLAWITVPADAYRALGATSDDLEGMVEYPRSLRGVEVALTFRETEPGSVKVSFRSNGPVDVNAIARSFGGGGHVKASGALVKGTLEEVRKRVIEATARAVEETVGGEEGSG